MPDLNPARADAVPDTKDMMTTLNDESPTTAALPPPAARSVGFKSRGSVRVLALAVVGALVFVGLAVALVLQKLAHDNASNGESLRPQAMAAADRVVLKLTTLSGTTAQANITSLLKDATASFKSQLAQESAALQQAIQQAKVSTTASIDATGVVSVNTKTNTVVVLVASEQTVTNASTPKGEKRNYRLQVTMQKDAGTWLVSDMTFVA